MRIKLSKLYPLHPKWVSHRSSQTSLHSGIRQPYSRRSRIFLRGRPLRVKCQVVDAIQWGGGVVAEFSRDLTESTRFSGGGVVAEFSRDLPESHAIHFCVLSINPTPRDSSVGSGGGGSATNFPLMGPFTFFFFPKGGGPGPPPESATAIGL